MKGTKIAAGNFLLSFAILLAGASGSSVLRVFSHMGLFSFSLRTSYNHQRESKMGQLGNLIYKNYCSLHSGLSLSLLIMHPQVMLEKYVKYLVFSSYSTSFFYKG